MSKKREVDVSGFPLPHTTSEVGTKARELYVKWKTLVAKTHEPNQRHREAQLEHRAAQRAFSEANAEAATKGKAIPPATRKRLIERIDKAAEVVNEPWEAETDGLRQAAQAAHSEYGRFLDEHMVELMAEHDERAYGVAGKIREPAAALAAWAQEQYAVSRDFNELARYASDPGRNLVIGDKVDGRAIQHLVDIAEVPPVMKAPAHKWAQFIEIREGVGEVDAAEELPDAEPDEHVGPIPIGDDILYFPGPKQ